MDTLALTQFCPFKGVSEQLCCLVRAFLLGHKLVIAEKLASTSVTPRTPGTPITPGFYSTRVKILAMSESRAEAIRLLGLAADRSHRSSVAYAPAFVRSAPGTPDVIPATPPLARLIQGGRGGGTRLPLYLLLTMIATRSPFDIRNPPTAITLARTLDLPPGTGPRRITSNMKWLADNHFIELTRRPGLTPSIQLLDPHGSGRPMSDARGGRYVSFPIGFWSHGWLLHLPPVAIAILFALKELLGGSKVPRYMLRDRLGSYELSHDTWTRGRHELERARLLTVKRVPQGDEYVYTRLRNSYWLDTASLNGPVPDQREDPWASGSTGFNDEPPF
jgi:hypothetical protein